MANVYAERAQAKEAQNILFWSKVKNAISYVPWALGLACAGVAWVFATVGGGCKTYSENLHSQSKQDKKQAEQIINDSKENWKREVRNEKIDSDFISITSSEYGEVVDVA